MKYQIEFEWSEEDLEKKKVTKAKMEAVYHEIDTACQLACHGNGVPLPDVAWMIVTSKCPKCDGEVHEGTIQ